jgi:hypothetical protein
MAKITFESISYLKMTPRMKNRTPVVIAKNEIILMNLSISCCKGVSPASAEDAKLAICPITVLSPVLKQIPSPCPAVH